MQACFPLLYSILPSWACAFKRNDIGKKIVKRINFLIAVVLAKDKIKKKMNTAFTSGNCLIRSQRVHLLKYPKSFEWYKKTSRANFMVWCAHNCQSFSRLPDESEPAIYFFACRHYGRSYPGLCDHSFFKCAVHLWDGDCLFSIFTIRG